MKKQIFTLLTLLLSVCSGAWADSGTEVVAAGSWSSGNAYSGTAVTGAGIYSSGDGGGNIKGYTPNNKGVKLNVRHNNSRVTVSSTTYGYVLLTINSGYKITSFKLEGTSNADGDDASKLVTLKGIYFDVAGAGTDAFGTNIAAATNQITADVVYPKNSADYVSSPSLTSLNATTNVVLLFDVNSNSQMRAIFTIGWEKPGPTINTQPNSASYVVGQIAVPLSVDATASAGEIAYQWYSNTTNSTEGATEIIGATNATYTPSIASAGTNFYYCKVTDDNDNKNSNIAGIIVGNAKTARLPLTGSEGISSNSFTSGDYTFSSTAKIEHSSRNLYPAPHVKANNGTITITAQEDAIQYVKIIGSCNSASATTITAGSGSTLVSGNEFIALDTKNGDDLVLSEVIIKPNTTSAGNSVSFVVGSQSRLFVEVYGNSTKVANAIIGEYEWSTFVSDKILDFTGLNVKAYAVTGRTENAIIKSDALTTVPANTPLLLNASEGVYTIPVAASASSIGTNLLQAGDGSAVSAEATNTKYVLSVVGGKAGFKKIVDGKAATVAEGKAYLLFNEVISARDFLGFEDEDVTAIESVKTQKADGQYFNLAGQRVAQPTNGLYIVNGKKVIIK